MPHPLDPFAPNILAALGHQGTLEQFARFLRPPGTGRRFRSQPGASAEQCMVNSPGVLLMLQRTEPGASPEQTQWGLHSITLHTALSPMSTEAWTDAWPANLPAEKTTLQDVSAAFGAPQVQMQGLAIFTLKGPQNQNWGLQCQFDEAGHLQTFTVAHLDEWLPLPMAPTAAPAPQLPATTIAAPPPASIDGPPVTCATAGVVPKTGWYEGRLPRSHPDHDYFSRRSERFAHREKGQRMVSLGVVPHADEALVVWTWVGEKQPR